MKREKLKIGEYEFDLIVTDQLPEGVDLMLVGPPDPDAEDQLESMARRSAVVRSDGSADVP